MTEPGPFQATATASVPIDLFGYRPTGSVRQTIVVMHGVLRNADEYRDHAIGLSERTSSLIIAPHFDEERFPSWRYHRGGVLSEPGEPRPASEWTYEILRSAIGDALVSQGVSHLPFHFLGHSAGGQFLMRMAAFVDLGAARIVAANAGSVMFPSRDYPFGYGFGGLPENFGDDTALSAYLARPLTIFAGTADTEADEHLDQSEAAMRQGPNRYQRNLAAYLAAQDVAAQRGWDCQWRFVEAPGVGHDHAAMFDHAQAEVALFGTKSGSS